MWRSLALLAPRPPSPPPPVLPLLATISPPPWPPGGPDATGVVVIAGHLAAVAAVAALAILAESTGRGLLTRLGGDDHDGTDVELVERTTAAILAGLGLWATLLLLLAMLGGLRPAPMALLATLGLVIRRRDLPAAARRILRAAGAPVRSLPPGAARLAGAGVVAALVTLTLPRALLPAVDWDSLMYHLPVPLSLLEAGRLVVPIDNLHVAYAGLTHLLSVPFLAAGIPAAVQLLGWGVAAVLVGSVWAAGTRWGGSVAGAGAAVALVGSTPVLLVAATPRVDVTLAAWMWVGHAALLRLAFDGWSRRTAAEAAVVLGLGIGVKYHALAYGLVLVPLTLVAVARSADSWRDRGLRAAGMAVGAGLLGLPWLAKNSLLFGSPLYPFGGERVVPPWLAARLGAPLHPDAVGLDIYWILREARAPFHVLTFLTDPGSVSVEGEAAFFLLSPLLLLAVAGVAGARARSRWLGIALVGPALGFAAAILAVSLRTNPRYLIPALPGLAVAAGLGLGAVSHRLPPRLRTAVVGVLLLLGLAAIARISTTALHPGLPVGHGLGVLSARETLDQRGAGGLLVLAERLERDVPGGSRALLIAEARGLYLGDVALQDNVLTNWPLLTAGDPEADCLAGAGISHLVVGRGTLEFYHRRGVDTTPLRLDRLEAFLDRCAAGRDPLGPWEIIRLRPRGSFQDRAPAPIFALPRFAGPLHPLQESPP